MSDFFLVILLFFISVSGIGLYCFEKINQKILHLLIALGAGTMFSVALVHILPESLEENNLAIYAFVCGFLVIYFLEEVLTMHHHDHNHQGHTHEDPHEHFNHVILVSWIAIFIHTIFDGLGIRAGFSLNRDVGMSILAGVAIHQIPVSLSVASMLRESQFSKNIQIALIIIFAGAAPLGFLLTGNLVEHISTSFVSLATAFAGGSLLYVSNVELLPMIHAQSSRRMQYITLTLFIIGVIGMSLVKTLE